MRTRIVMGKVKTAELVKLLGEELTITRSESELNNRKSPKPKKYPLNIYHPATGFIFFSSTAGQEFLRARITDRATAREARAEKTAEPKPAAPAAQNAEPKPAAPAAQNAEKTAEPKEPKPAKKTWFDEI